jgi:hypothetical protein
VSGPVDWTLFLHPDDDDAGCNRTLELADVYAEQELAGATPWHTYPDVASHLRSCPGCSEDYRGILAAITLG